MARPATGREETAVLTSSVGRAAPARAIPPAGTAPDSGSGASDNEVFLVSAGSLVRPTKPLRAAPRCTVLGVPAAAAVLSRTDDRPGGVPLSPRPARAEAVSRPVAKAGAVKRVSPKRPAAARFYRRLGAAAAFGGAALLGALTAFAIGERLLWPGASAPPSPAEPQVTPSALQPVAVRPDATRPPRVDLVDASGLAPVPVSSGTTAAPSPPWRDGAVVPSDASRPAAEEFAALVRDNLRLDAEVVALETETTELQEMLLDRELRLFSAGLSLEGPIGETVSSDPADGLADTSTFSDEEAARLSEEDGDFDALEPLDSETTSESRDPFLDEELELDEELAFDEELALDAATVEEPLQRFVVADVPPGSTAESVGLMEGDVVLEIDDIEIIDIEDLVAAGEGNVEGRLHELTIVREGARFPLAYADNIGSLSLRLDWVEPLSTDW